MWQPRGNRPADWAGQGVGQNWICAASFRRGGGHCGLQGRLLCGGAGLQGCGKGGGGRKSLMWGSFVKISVSFVSIALVAQRFCIDYFQVY